MLKHLLIKNYALIEHLEMDPSPRFNIITGETGAGKSIMLGAIGLLLGNRADTRALFDEEKKCVIEGTFNLSGFKLKSLFEQEDLDYEKETVIRREINPAGKSRAFINDLPVTLPVLKKVGNRLMDIHSQHDNLLLGNNLFQLNIVDNYAQHPALIKQYQVAYHELQKLRGNYEELLANAEKMQQDYDYHSFLLKELSEAQMSADEQHTLEEQLKLLENAEDIKLRLNEILEVLDRSEFPVNGGLVTVNQNLSRLAPLSDQYQSLSERLDSSAIELKDITQEIENLEERIHHDPEELQRVQDRLNLIYRLQQKHKVSDIQSLLDLQSTLEEKVSQVENMDETLEKAKKLAYEKEREVLKFGSQLTSSRKKVVKSIEKQLETGLQALGMPNASLKIDIRDTAPGPNGMDHVEMLFSANKGIAPQEIKHVASGGEFSRLMFCIKHLQASKVNMPTIIFDEIDTGVSGEIALKMVTMMKEMARNHQVISISHLPQFAAKGDAHYFVYKDHSAAKSVSKMRLLTKDERVMEIAKMIGGESPSQSAFQNARELMES